MKEKNRFMNKYGKYLILVLFFLFWNLIVQAINLDEIWNYGFSYAIVRGEIPYLDFNMVITPLFPFLMALFLKIFGNSILVFHVIFSLILGGMFYILFKLIKEKSYIVLFFLIFPLSVLFPSYNLFFLFLYILLIYLEKEEANDYLIGLVLAGLILTKQTVGLMLILPNLFYFSKPKKILKRFISCFITGIIFVLYLVISGSFQAFVNLCFWGLFDFAEKNGSGFNFLVIATILLIIVTIIFILKDKKNINNYYFLAFTSMVLPLFDLYHFELVFVAFLILVFMKREIDLKINIKLFTICVLTFLSVMTIENRSKNTTLIFSNIKNLEGRVISKEYLKYTNNLIQLGDKYKDRKIILLSADGYFYKIINDLDISYLDLINMGNWGRDGSSKLLNEVKNCERCVFFIDKREYGKGKQSDQRVLEYVLNNYREIDYLGIYYVYEGDTNEKICREKP